MQTELVQTIMAMLSPAMAAITWAYIRSILKKVDRIEVIEKQILEGTIKLSSLDNIKQEWGAVRMELAKLTVKLETLQTSSEELSVLKRDVRSVWSNIDQLKDNMFDARHKTNEDI